MRQFHGNDFICLKSTWTFLHFEEIELFYFYKRNYSMVRISPSVLVIILQRSLHHTRNNQKTFKMTLYGTQISPPLSFI